MANGKTIDDLEDIQIQQTILFEDIKQLLKDIKDLLTI